MGCSVTGEPGKAAAVCTKLGIVELDTEKTMGRKTRWSALPAGWACRGSSGCTTTARALACTCLVTGGLGVGHQLRRTHKVEAREREMHGLLGDWRTEGSVAVCTTLSGC